MIFLPPKSCQERLLPLINAIIPLVSTHPHTHTSSLQDLEEILMAAQPRASTSADSEDDMTGNEEAERNLAGALATLEVHGMQQAPLRRFHTDGRPETMPAVPAISGSVPPVSTAGQAVGSGPGSTGSGHQIAVRGLTSVICVSGFLSTPEGLTKPWR